MTAVLGGIAAFVDHETPLHEEDDAFGQTEMEGAKIMLPSSLHPLKAYEEDLTKWKPYDFELLVTQNGKEKDNFECIYIIK